MSVKVTFEFDTVDAAILQLARLRGPDAAPAAAPAAGKPVKAEKPAPTPPSAPAAPAVAPVTPDIGAAEAAALHEKVKAAITAATKDTANVPATKAVLTKYGAKTGKDLKPADYAAFLVDLEAALQPAEDLAG